MEADPKYRTEMQLRWNINSLFRRVGVGVKNKTCSEYGIDFDQIYKSLGPRPVGFHLDHIIPICKFDLTNETHVKLAWSVDNLRWISGADNIKKRSSVIPELLTPNLLKIAEYIGLHLP